MFVGLLWCIEHFDKGFMWINLFFLPKLYYVCDIIIFIPTVKKKWENLSDLPKVLQLGKWQNRESDCEDWLQGLNSE